MSQEQIVMLLAAVALAYYYLNQSHKVQAIWAVTSNTPPIQIIPTQGSQDQFEQSIPATKKQCLEPPNDVWKVQHAKECAPILAQWR